MRTSMTRLLAAFAIGLQMILQGAIALGPSHGFDVTSLYCAAPDQQSSPEVTAALRELAISFGLETPQEDAASQHCPLCVLTHGAPVQALVMLARPARTVLAEQPIGHEPAFFKLAQGPPLGSRAPPAHI